MRYEGGVRRWAMLRGGRVHLMREVEFGFLATRCGRVVNPDPAVREVPASFARRLRCPRCLAREEGDARQLGLPHRAWSGWNER